MALCVVDPVDAEMSHVLWLIAPEELYVACGAAVALGLPQGTDVLHAQVALMPLGSINTLVGLELAADVLVGRGLVISRWGWAIGVWWGAAPGELVEVPHSRDSKVCEVAPLDVVVDDPDLLRVFDGQALARVHGHGVAQGPVLPPFVIKDLPGGLYAHLHNVIQDQLLLGRVWARDRYKDVLFSRIPRTIQKWRGFVREGFFVMLEQKLLGLVAWGLARDKDQVAGVPIVNKVGPAAALG